MCVSKQAFFRFVFALLMLCAVCGQINAAESTVDFDPDNPPMGLFIEEWLELSMNGQKIGYTHITMRRQGGNVITETEMFMRIMRGDVALEFTTRETSLETIPGEPLGFNYDISMGQMPIINEGTIEDGVIYLETNSMGAVQTREIPYPAGAIMTWGMTRKSINTAFAPGLVMDFKTYMPSVSLEQPIDTRFEILDEDVLELNGVRHDVWRATMTMEISGTPIVSDCWMDEDGRLLKSSSMVMGMPMLMVAVDEETALKDFIPAEVFEVNLVQLDQHIPKDAQEVVYRVTLSNPNAEEAGLVETDYQKVQRVSENQFLVTVMRADHASLPDSEDGTGPGEAYFEANLILDSEDEVVSGLLAQAIPPQSKTAAQQADALRVFVTNYIEDKNLNVGFATASEVARNPQGDCTEHAVLLAALGRSAGIPTRVAAGLVYLPSWLDAEGELRRNVMGYHMWTQVYLGGKWVDFDAAQDESECAPTRLTMMTSSLRDSSISELGLEMLDLMGQIHIEVVSIK